MANNISQKLRLTAALIGAVTRKDLAAAFRRINPASAFDVDRADKWLQGRAKPRQFSVYDDWMKLLELQQPADWIADCDLEDFIEQICSRHDRDRALLERRAAAFGKPPLIGQDDKGATIAGQYVCYSHSWSPYTSGLMMRSTLLIEQENGPPRLTATYTEHLPTVLLQLKGQVIVTRRSVFIHVGGAADDAHFFFCLFPFSPPGSVLGGYMTGIPIFGPESQPSVTRMVLARIKEPENQSSIEGAYLEPAATITEDLKNFRVNLDDPDASNAYLSTFLSPAAGGTDKIPKDDFQRLVETFDRAWLRN